MTAGMSARRAWRLLTDDGVGAAEGLALDEALMAGHRRDADPEPAVGTDVPATLRLYTYRSHCALVGRYQDLAAEVDLAAARRTCTQVSRRPTGGGAIIMGAGQLGVALVTRVPADRRPRELLAGYARGVVAGLARLGVPAEFRGKNDIEVGDRKIAGLGLYVDDGGALLFHASVLASLDVPFLLEVLRIPAGKLADKGLSAVRERITTVSDQLGSPVDGAGLRDALAAGFADAFGVTWARGVPSPTERARAAALVESRYAAQDWLDERTAGPEATGSAALRTPSGRLRLYLATRGDLVTSALFAGDVNELPAPLRRLETGLRWQRLDPAGVRRTVADAVGESGELGVSTDDLVTAVLTAGRTAARVASPVRSSGSCYFPDQPARPAVHVAGPS